MRNFREEETYQYVVGKYRMLNNELSDYRSKMEVKNHMLKMDLENSNNNNNRLLMELSMTKEELKRERNKLYWLPIVIGIVEFAFISLILK